MGWIKDRYGWIRVRNRMDIGVIWDGYEIYIWWTWDGMDMREIKGRCRFDIGLIWVEFGMDMGWNYDGYGMGIGWI
jgi:hypothetical protein